MVLADDIFLLLLKQTITKLSLGFAFILLHQTTERSDMLISQNFSKNESKKCITLLHINHFFYAYNK